MRSVTTGTIGHDLRSQSRRQPVIAGEVRRGAAAFNAKFLREPYSFMAARTGELRDVLGGDRRICIPVSLDGVDAMAIGTDWRLPICLRDRLPVNTLLKFLRNLLVAFAAGLRHIEFENRGFRVLGVENLMRAVTIGADRSFFRTIGDCMPVNALFIGGDRLHTESALLHHELLAVTGPASRRNVRVMDTRFRIACRQ